MRLFLAAMTVIVLSSCSNVTVRTSGTAKLIREPDWKERQPFFMYGIVGKNRVDAAKICGGRSVEQVALETSFWDGFFKYATVLFFTPKTAMVWCRKEGT